MGRLLLSSPCFKAAVAERDSEHAGLLSEGTWATLKCSRDGFDRRFVFRVLSQLFHISTGPITTQTRFLAAPVLAINYSFLFHRF